jgi:pimeloyl-ACP methyl ester carboxylesterase
VRQLGIERCHWLGTSMGGAIGTVARRLLRARAGAPHPSLVLNDNAPAAGAMRPSSASRPTPGQPAAFATVSELEAFFRAVYQPYGFLTDAQWRRLAETSTRRLPDGRVTPHYDPAIVGQFTHHPDDYRIWHHYDALKLPVLLLRGAESDLVLRQTAEQMRTRGPGARGQLRWVEVPGCGHAPALNVAEQVDLVSDFIERA